MAALEGADGYRQSRDRQDERRAHQLCRQVQRALNLALADSPGREGLNDLFVEEVAPAPDCSRLLVHVVVPDDLSAGEVLETLRRSAPRLRSEVAAAITRKRAPELSFAPVFHGEGNDD
jgi:ribosome-binding factor A